MGRIEPLPPDKWPAEMRDALAAMRPANPRHPLPSRAEGRPKGLNALGVLAHHPELTKAFNTFNGHTQFATTLTARQRELLILRVASLRQSDYEWAQHAVLAADAGLDATEVAAIAAGPDAGERAPLEQALLPSV